MDLFGSGIFGVLGGGVREAVPPVGVGVDVGAAELVVAGVIGTLPERDEGVDEDGVPVDTDGLEAVLVEEVAVLVVEVVALDDEFETDEVAVVVETFVVVVDVVDNKDGVSVEIEDDP